MTRFRYIYLRSQIIRKILTYKKVQKMFFSVQDGSLNTLTEKNSRYN